jgi:hypothetical protein
VRIFHRCAVPNCYAPTWGVQMTRTKPSAGNHDYHTPDAPGCTRLLRRQGRRPLQRLLYLQAGQLAYSRARQQLV